MASASSIASLVGRLRGQRPAVPGGTRREFLGDGFVTQSAHLPGTGAVVRLIPRPVASCPTCSAAVTQHATSCHGCGDVLIRASA